MGLNRHAEALGLAEQAARESEAAGTSIETARCLLYAARAHASLAHGSAGNRTARKSRGHVRAGWAHHRARDRRTRARPPVPEGWALGTGRSRSRSRARSLRRAQPARPPGPGRARPGLGGAWPGAGPGRGQPGALGAAGERRAAALAALARGPPRPGPRRRASVQPRAQRRPWTSMTSRSPISNASRAPWCRSCGSSFWATSCRSTKTPSTVRCSSGSQSERSAIWSEPNRAPWWTTSPSTPDIRRGRASRTRGVAAELARLRDEHNWFYNRLNGYSLAEPAAAQMPDAEIELLRAAVAKSERGIRALLDNEALEQPGLEELDGQRPQSSYGLPGARRRNRAGRVLSAPRRWRGVRRRRG